MKRNPITRGAIAHASLVLAALALSSFSSCLAADQATTKPVPSAAENLLHETPYYGVQLGEEQPEFVGFWLDSLGKGRKWHSSMLVGNLKQSYRRESRDGWIHYHPVGSSDALTGFKFDANSILIRSEARADDAVEPFVMKFNLKGRHPAFATLLGRMEKAGEVNLPAVLHIPGQGTVRITARSAQATPLHLKVEGEKKTVSEEVGYSKHVKMTFPAASESCAWIEYRLEVVNIHPQTAGLENDERFDGYRRCWLNILQMSPARRMLANNAVSDVCGLCYHEYGEVAALTGELAEGVSGPILLRDSLNRFLDDGELGYGMAKYKGEPHYPEASLDTWPSLLIGAHLYYQASGDQPWLERQIDRLTKWGEASLVTDKNGNGLIEYHQSGNAGDCHFRPANWWDAINFGHEDAYSNALAYRAFRGLAAMQKKAGKDDQAERFEKAAQKLKDAYYKTFYNPETGMLAGWKSRDGKLHDYGFTFIQGLAISYGLIEDAATANQILDATLKKIKDVGFNRFDLGLPGNLVAIPPEDYFQKFMKPSWEKQRHPFQTYENGGASANHTYYLIAALYQHGRIKDGDMILLPILKSFNEGGFSGFEGPWKSYDWVSWDGKPSGYEGLLVDNYLAVKAVLVRQGLVDPVWGSYRSSPPGR
ncbi:MAG TPA: hypothetical protein VFY13_04895 [Luteolibacter sp.]|nr:hypothetical protein [Luteolibacter sp.]